MADILDNAQQASGITITPSETQTAGTAPPPTDPSVSESLPLEPPPVPPESRVIQDVIAREPLPAPRVDPDSLIVPPAATSKKEPKPSLASHAKPPPSNPPDTTGRKKSRAGVILATLLLLLITLPLGVYFVSQQAQLADTRSRAVVTGYCGVNDPYFTTNELTTCRNAGDCMTTSSTTCLSFGSCCKWVTPPPTVTAAPTNAPACPRACNSAPCYTVGMDDDNSGSCTSGYCCKPRPTVPTAQDTTITPENVYQGCCKKTNRAIDINTCAPPASEKACNLNTASCFGPIYNNETCDAKYGTPDQITLPPAGGTSGGNWACGGGTGVAPATGTACVNGGGTYNGKCAVYRCPNGCAGSACGENSPGFQLEFVSCSSASLASGECGQIDTVTDENRYCQPETGCDVKAINCSGSCAGGTAVTPIPTNAPQCPAISVYKDGLLVTDLSTLMPGNQITIVVGSAATQVRVNGSTFTALTTKNAGGEWTYDYTIPADATVVSIEVQ
jgi:hypothetical protein